MKDMFLLHYKSLTFCHQQNQIKIELDCIMCTRIHQTVDCITNKMKKFLLSGHIDHGKSTLGGIF